MDIEKIKAMYAYSKEIQERSRQFNADIALSEKEAFNKTIKKIHEFFNTILDNMGDDYIHIEIGCSSENDLVLRKKGDLKYATFPYNYNEILVCTNYSGTMKNEYKNDVTINKYYYYNLFNYHNKEELVDYFLRNKEKIEKSIYDAISQSVNKKMQETANEIQDKAAYLERLNNYTK